MKPIKQGRIVTPIFALIVGVAMIPPVAMKIGSTMPFTAEVTLPWLIVLGFLIAFNTYCGNKLDTVLRELRIGGAVE